MPVDLATRPTERADAYEDAWSSMVAAWWSDGVWPGQFNRGEVFADGTGVQIKVRSLKVNVQGFHGEKSTESLVGLSNANPSFPRIDRVVARLDRTKPATIRLDVITGTPAASPSPSPLVRNSTTYDIPLALVLVPAGASSIQASNVTDEREYAAPRVTDQAGVVKQFLGTIAPEGYLLMAGQTVNRADYPALARLLGVNTPTFIVPDMRGRYAEGAASTTSPGGVGGADTMALAQTHLAPHVHGINDPGHGHSIFDPQHRHPVGSGTGYQNQIVISPGGEQQNWIPGLAGGAGGPGNAQVTFTNVGHAATGVAVIAGGTGISVQSAGNGTPFSLKSPYRAMNFIVKAH